MQRDRGAMFGSVSQLTRKSLPFVVGVLGISYVVADVSIYRALVMLVAYGIIQLIVSRQLVSKWIIVVVLAGLFAGALAEYPDGSDLWPYQSYGRMIVEYHENPYIKVPADFPDDPVMERVLPMYRNVPSVYGPIMVLGSAVIARLTGESRTAGRLLWQSAGLGAVLASLWLMRRRGVDRGNLWLFASSPLVVYHLVNQAHNDVFVGLFLLIGCLVAERRRPVVAALCFSAAALVKLPAVIALVVFIVWLVGQREYRSAVKAVLASAAGAIVVMLPFGVSNVLEPVVGEKGAVNATSLWNFVRGDAATFLWRPLRSVESDAGTLLSVIAIMLPLIVAVVAAWRGRGCPLHRSVTVGLLAYFVFALHPSVWFLGWLLPLAALWPRDDALRIVGYSSLCLVTSQAWLMPVAARLSGDGQLDLVDRLASVSLGVSTLAGLWLVGRLMVPLSVDSDKRG